MAETWFHFLEWCLFCDCSRNWQGGGLHCHVQIRRRWDGKNKTCEDYLSWKAGHVCNVNYEGSSGGMEPHGTLKMFQRSLDFHLRY